MNSFQKIGGAAALVHSAAYMIAIGLYVTVLTPILDANSGQYLALLKDYQSLMYVWIFIAYWVSGFCLIVVSLMLYDQLKGGMPVIIQTGTILGLIWAGLIIASGNLMLHDFGVLANLYDKDPIQAETVWKSLSATENGIISGNELIGGLWILLVSWVALRTGERHRALSYFGLMIGVSGIVSIVPAFAEVATGIFALTMILWFAWVGIVMLRGSQYKQMTALD